MEALKPTKADEELVRKALVDWTKSQSTRDRFVTRRAYQDIREAFVQTFGDVQWRALFGRVVDEERLGVFLFDEAEARDGL